MIKAINAAVPRHENPGKDGGLLAAPSAVEAAADGGVLPAGSVLREAAAGLFVFIAYGIGQIIRQVMTREKVSNLQGFTILLVPQQLDNHGRVRD
jgi:hypothetical protein